MLEKLLFVSIGVANLDEMFFATRLSDRSVIKASDDLFADLASLKSEQTVRGSLDFRNLKCLPSKANTTSIAATIAENSARANLMGCKNSSKFLATG